MRSLLLPVFLYACAASSYAADPAPAPAAAKQASDLLQTREEVVKAADLKAIAGLKKLMAKYKKDTPTLTMLAVKLHKLDPNDADAIAVLKDVPADQADLLGDAAVPGKYMTDVQAKVIADALAKGKFTGKDWEVLPGAVVEVNARPNKNQPMLGGRKIMVVPNPDDKWRGSNERAFTDWKGKDNEMRLSAYVFAEDGKTEPQMIPLGGAPVQVKEGTQFRLRTCTGGSIDAIGDGMIRVKVYEVVPVGE